MYGDGLWGYLGVGGHAVGGPLGARRGDVVTHVTIAEARGREHGREA